MGLSRKEFAEKAGVSKQAISYALKKSWLRAEPDGTLDPERKPNADYLALHAEGYDCRARAMDTHTGPGHSGSAQVSLLDSNGGTSYPMGAGDSRDPWRLHQIRKVVIDGFRDGLKKPYAPRLGLRSWQVRRAS